MMKLLVRYTTLSWSIAERPEEGGVQDVRTGENPDVFVRIVK